MDVTILGSGSPIPDPQRAGTGITISIDGELVLLDCGPGTVERMLDADINPKSIESVFFTHHHMDHNASFFHFAIASWTLGRRDLTVYGPTGTTSLVEAMYQVYESDLEYRRSFGRSLDGITDIEIVDVDDEFASRIGNCRISAMQVDHSIETYAYRFDDESTGESVVFSGDTTIVDGFAEFAQGADVLIQDACIGPMLDTPPSNKPVWTKYFSPDQRYLDRLGEVHCTPAECGEIAADADVDTLVLTHLTPYLDPEQMKSNAQQSFDGAVIVAEDGLQLKSPL
ncbi:MBL fold metallo-hydrolase [Haloarcula sp. JP-L23]|uniref:MBL fold metallo-hydrolase n=1 Tax=Haloarcula sp. JP-L23 TaxID=2716717 RepID=UPI00140F4A83|nr:MBL fold metallo-hydrolase [Haloarcula sp. JP-L23]